MIEFSLTFTRSGIFVVQLAKRVVKFTIFILFTNAYLFQIMARKNENLVLNIHVCVFIMWFYVQTFYFL